MRFINWLKQSSFWLVLPSVAVAAAIGTAMAGYTPLVFDPSLYQAQTADAAELATIDAEALEAANKGDEAVEAQASAADVSSSALADGTWTGYAACGQGNSDGWKPYYVGVTVEVSGGASQGITNVFGSSTGNAGSTSLSWDASENQSYLSWAEDGRNGETGVKSQINAMAASGTVSNVDTVSKATYSSVAIYNAYVDALNQAAAAAGNAGENAQAPDAGGKKPGKESVKADGEIGALADGTWTAYVQCGPDPDDEWKPYYVGVTATVRGGAVASIDSIVGSSTGEPGNRVLTWDESENGAYLDWAVSGRMRSGVSYAGVKPQIESALARGSNPRSIDTVSGATFSSKAIFSAFYAALAKSAAVAGSAIDEPDQPADVPDDNSGDAPTPADPGSGTVDLPEGVPSIFGSFPDGTYRGWALCGVGNGDGWNPYYLIVDVEASGGRIVKVANAFGDAEGIVDPAYVYDSSENAVYLKRALTYQGRLLQGVQLQVQAKLDASSEVTGIDTVSNATYSCTAFIEAFYNAVRAAHETT